jgi:hypothetical protein
MLGQIYTSLMGVYQLSVIFFILVHLRCLLTSSMILIYQGKNDK